MAKQAALFTDDKADPKVAQIADRYVELKKEKETASEGLLKSAEELVRLLKKANKSRVRHGDMIIELSHKEAAESIKIKKAKQPPVKKVKPELQAPAK